MGRLARSGIPYEDLVLPIYVPSLLVAVSQGALIPVLPLYARSFGTSYGLIGLLLAGQALGTLLADVPAGIVLRRIGTHAAMVLGMAITVVSIFALFWARSVPEALIYRVIGGAGGALFTVSRHAYMAGIVRKDSRGRAISLQGGVFRAGRLVGPALGGAMASSFGLRAPFLIVGLLCAAAGVLVAVSGRKIADEVTEGGPGQGWKTSALRRALRSRPRDLTFAGIGYLFAQMIRAGRTIVVPLYAADVLGLDVRSIGFLETAARTVDLAMFVPAGLLMDRKGRKWAIVPSFLIQAIGMALVPLTADPLQLLAATCVYGIGNGLGSGSMMTLGADLAPESARGEFLGVWRLIGDSGATGGPLAVGAIADLLALPAAILAISGTGLIAAVVFAFLVPETLGPRKDDIRTAPT